MSLGKNWSLGHLQIVGVLWRAPMHQWTMKSWNGSTVRWASSEWSRVSTHKTTISAELQPGAHCCPSGWETQHVFPGTAATLLLLGQPGCCSWKDWLFPFELLHSGKQSRAYDAPLAHVVLSGGGTQGRDQQLPVKAASSGDSALGWAAWVREECLESAMPEAWGRMSFGVSFAILATYFSLRGGFLMSRMKRKVPITQGHTSDINICWASLWLSGKESACQCRRHGFDPWSGKIPKAADGLSPSHPIEPAP